MDFGQISVVNNESFVRIACSNMQHVVRQTLNRGCIVRVVSSHTFHSCADLLVNMLEVGALAEMTRVDGEVLRRRDLEARD